MSRGTLALISLLPFLHVAFAVQQGKIHYQGSATECLGVKTPTLDAPVEILSCADNSAWITWDYTQPGDNMSIQLVSTNLCLDAGSNPANNGPAKLYTCYPGLAQQHWYFTADDRLALTGGNQCLDRANGNGAPQTYNCLTGNTNQMWTPDAMPTPTTTFTPTPTPTPTTVQWIHPNSDPSMCLTVLGVYQGAGIGVGTCGSTEYPSDFVIHAGDNAGIYFAGTNLCITPSYEAENGDSLQLSYCLEDSLEHFYYTNDQRIAITGGTACLDQDGGRNGRVQTWDCTPGDVNQIWTLTNVQATITTTTDFPNPTTVCQIGHQQVLTPSAGTNITQTYPSDVVPFTYCSGEYFKTNSLNITVFLASAADTNPVKDGVVVGTSTKLNAPNGFGYSLNLAIPKNTKPAPNSQLYVLEWFSNSYGPDPYQTTWSTIDVEF